MQQAEDLCPGTFRYSDGDLGSGVRTSVAQEGGLCTIAKAELFRPDAICEVLGTAWYTVAASDGCPTTSNRRSVILTHRASTGNGRCDLFETILE